MNLASALLKQIIDCKDLDTWASVRKHYLPTEYHHVFDAIQKYSDTYFKLPETLEELAAGTKDGPTGEKLYAIASVETEIEPHILLDYVKNEYAQKEALTRLGNWIDTSIAFENAEEVVRSLQSIGMELEAKVEIVPPEETMQKINLFESEDEMAKRIRLGLNSDFDKVYDFKSTDYIMMGGKRGSGKSLTCSNLARRVIDKNKKKVLYFSIEMEPREVLQRDCSIATGIPFSNIRNKNIDHGDWPKIVKYWADRYQGSEAAVEAWKQHQDFNKFHLQVSRLPLVDHVLEIIYDPSLTLARIQAEVRKYSGKENEEGEPILGLIIVDYINKVKRLANMANNDHLDWKEQLTISHALKTMAQETKTPVFSPYQTDASGEARISKGILDSCDAAFVLTAHKDCITFDCVKMRGGEDDVSFTSATNWTCLSIGPDSAVPPLDTDEEEKPKRKSRVKTPPKNAGAEPIHETLGDEVPF